MLYRISTVLTFVLLLTATCYSETKKEKYIFYLTSSSVPFVSVKSVIEQSQKIDTRLIIVLYGIDKQRSLLKRLDGVVSDKNVLIKPHPYIFDDNGVKQVPAFITATCPDYNDFHSEDCVYENIVYGDISLAGFLKIVSEHDKELIKDYEKVKGI